MGLRIHIAKDKLFTILSLVTEVLKLVITPKDKLPTK